MNYLMIYLLGVSLWLMFDHKIVGFVFEEMMHIYNPSFKEILFRALLWPFYLMLIICIGIEWLFNKLQP